MIPLARASLVGALLASAVPALAQTPPLLTWITNSSVKLEQIIADVDWATGSNTASQTITRFNIEGTDLGCSFGNGTNLIFLFGDTIGSNVDYHAADPLAWCPTTSGETGLLLNFYTNSNGSNAFVKPSGISMGADDTPNAGITISNTVYLVCNTGADASNTTNAHLNAFSVLVTFDPTNLTFQTNRSISYTTNGGHFVFDSLHLDGTNVMIFGEGNFRNSDVYLSTVPVNSFLSGDGTLYFTGLSNGQPIWSTIESNAVPVVQDNPTNGPPWPNDSPSVGNPSIIYSTNLGLWMMTYDGGRHSSSPTNTAGIYFSFALQPWGPWSKPQMIFNATRDHGFGVFIYNPDYNPPGPAGPTVNPTNNPPTTTPGGEYAPYLIEPFTRLTNSTLYIYYVMATWNPYTVVKMRSAFDIVPVIDPASVAYNKTKGVSFSWNAPTNEIFRVEYADALPPAWSSFTNLITSTNGVFNFSDDGTNSGGLGGNRFYRLRTSP